MYGITSFSAVINPPQACILAVGAGIQKVLPPKANSTTNRPRVVTTVTVQLSADRRVIDEATAAQYLQVRLSFLTLTLFCYGIVCLFETISFILFRCDE